MVTNAPAHLEPSELGTKEYWDEYYSADLSAPPSPTASLDGWFSDVKAPSKILKFLRSPSLGLNPQKTRFLDLGTGNGEMLFRLRQEGGFEGPMIGVDYSEPSIHLAKKIAAARGLEGVEFEHWDIMREPPSNDWKNGFDIVLDKGTFDAISLSDERDERGRRLCEGYREHVEGLVKSNGYFLVTSCNWTEEELTQWFTSPVSGEPCFEVCGAISYPSFSFGGQSGQSISTLCFKRHLVP